MLKHFIILSILLLAVFYDVVAQSEEELLQQVELIKGDSNKVKLYHKLISLQEKQKNYDKAFAYAKKALELADRGMSKNMLGESQLLIGDLSAKINNHPDALNYYLLSLISFESLSKKEKIAESSLRLAALYSKLNNPQKTIDYGMRSLGIYETLKDGKGQEQTLNFLGEAHVRMQNWAKADETYQKLLALQEKNNSPQTAQTYGKLSFIAKNNQQNDKALVYAEKKYASLKTKNEPFQAAQVANNLGFLYRKQADNNKAILYFNEALGVFKKLSAESKEENAVILNNIGVTYSNLGDYKKARVYFADAQKISEKENNAPRIVESYNYLAAIDYIGANNTQALANIQKAIEIGEPAKAYEELIESYQILSEIYARENDFKKSNEALRKQQDLQALIEKTEQEQVERDKQAQLNLLKQENDIVADATEKERQAQKLNALELENRQKASELKLQEQKVLDLEREQQLKNATLRTQELQAEQTRQALAIAEQRLAIEKTNSEKAELAKETERASLKAKEQELVKESQQKAIDLLESDKKLKDEELQQKEIIQKFGIGFFVLIFLILLAIIYAFIQRQKTNKLLAKQQLELKSKNEELLSGEEELRQNMEELRATQETMRLKQVEVERANEKLTSSESILRKALEKTKKQEQELRSKNQQLLTNEEELRQNMEELQATQEALQLRKDELDTQNQKVTQSIRYAKQIQTAVLPTMLQRLAVFPDSFLIFRPKDIVSGDFFWISQHVDNKRIVAVVDCTGHGVPGAFMSLVGNNILNEIINQKDIYNPSKILTLLHKGIRLKLSQDEGANNDGMDMGLCLIENLPNDQFKVTYSGAKHRLYISHKNEILELRSDRKSIGGTKSENDRTFSEQELLLEKGDIMYLFTDGYIDQANYERKSFTSKKLQDLIVSIKHFDLKTQQHQLEDALEAHQGNVEQRDDITLLGIRL